MPFATNITDVVPLSPLSIFFRFSASSLLRVNLIYPALTLSFSLSCVRGVLVVVPVINQAPLEPSFSYPSSDYITMSLHSKRFHLYFESRMFLFFSGKDRLATFGQRVRRIPSSQGQGVCWIRALRSSIKADVFAELFEQVAIQAERA